MSKRMRRLGLLAAPAVIALVVAGSAVAGITPLFSATTTAEATVVSTRSCRATTRSRR